jgi:phosphoribosyl 1,2-cyclic phosphate phosphodiesterase
MVEWKNKVIVIDAGPDFRQQMLTNHVKKLDAILLTHLHKDHIAGLDDVRAFNFKQKKPMDIFADALTIQQVKNEFPYVFDGTDYPGIPQMNMHLIDDNPFVLDDIEIIPIPVLHYKLPVYGFRIDNFAYITDASYIPESSMQRLQNLEVLIINALRYEKHYSHFNVAEALEIVEKLKPKRAYFTHISHNLGLHEEVEASLPHHVFLAYDTLKIEID